MHPDITVGEFIDRLSAYDRDAVLRLAINPHFPMAHRVGDLIEATDAAGRPVVFLAETGQQDYLPPTVAQALTWHPPTVVPLRTRRAVARPRDGDGPGPQPNGRHS
ncbi:hypothetical protein [Streptomyces sp. H27-D2]|uniref:hypothetical protein n=1 Tax=Streptomyces sp. H27-D2 TaxID=3046304 RepID=UPI002DBDEEF4|nr:hypothetical protein [Streptomyces sp. H27-D2]MEC4019688.1 hypothetical protein [Streptomyces sp. H27-D2]